MFLCCTSSIFSQLHHSIKPHAVWDYIKIATIKSFSPVGFYQLLRSCEMILLPLQSSFESIDNVITSSISSKYLDLHSRENQKFRFKNYHFLGLALRVNRKHMRKMRHRKWQPMKSACAMKGVERFLIISQRYFPCPILVADITKKDLNHEEILL